MFIRKHPLSAPAGDGDGTAPLAPPLDSMPDDHTDEGWAEPPADAAPPEPPVEPSDDAPAEPKTALDAVNEALDKTADAEPKADAPPVQAEPQQQTAPVDQKAAERARLEALYTIPKGLHGEARAKYKALSDHARGLDTRVAEVAQQHQQVTERMSGFESVIKDAQADANDLAAALGYIKAVKTGDWDTALAFIDRERQNLSLHAGRKVEGVDPLVDQPDLRQRVDSMELSEADALELARARRQQAQASVQAEQQAQQHAQAQQYRAIEQARNEALSAINAWQQERQANDIDFAAKEKALTEYLQRPETKAVLQKIDATLWLDHVKAVYDSLHVPAAQRPVGNGGPSPLRPRGAGGRVVAEPGSALDAVNQRLGYA